MSDSAKYGGPAPPDKVHIRLYFGTVHIKAGADAAALRAAMDGHVLEEAKLVGTYVPDS